MEKKKYGKMETEEKDQWREEARKAEARAILISNEAGKLKATPRRRATQQARAWFQAATKIRIAIALDE